MHAAHASTRTAAQVAALTPPRPSLLPLWDRRLQTQLESDNGCGIPLLDPREQFMKFWCAPAPGGPAAPLNGPAKARGAASSSREPPA